jgi:hypothetical protein
MLSARLRSVIQREYRRLQHRSSLFTSERDFRRFNQGSVFSHNFCFCAYLRMLVHEVRFSRSSKWKVYRADTAFQRPALNFASVLVSWRSITILTMINGLVTNLYSTFHGVFEPSHSRLYSLERGWAAAGCPVGRLSAPRFFMPTARISGA